MSEYAVFADGFEDDLLDSISDERRRRAAAQALNRTARDMRAKAAQIIREEVNLPARFVSPGEKRLFVSRNAAPTSLEARITAQGRASSLARFITGPAPKPGKPGVWVEVDPGKPRLMKRAFVIRLPRGSDPVTDTAYNLALAIRLREGERLQNKVSARRVAKGLYVLYGPSVNQVFLNNSGGGVAADIAPEALERAHDEFLRLLKL